MAVDWASALLDPSKYPASAAVTRTPKSNLNRLGGRDRRSTGFGCIASLNDSRMWPPKSTLPDRQHPVRWARRLDDHRPVAQNVPHEVRIDSAIMLGADCDFDRVYFGGERAAVSLQSRRLPDRTKPPSGGARRLQWRRAAGRSGDR